MTPYMTTCLSCSFTHHFPGSSSQQEEVLYICEKCSSSNTKTTVDINSLVLEQINEIFRILYEGTEIEK